MTNRNYSEFPDATPPTGAEYVTLWQSGAVVKTALPLSSYTGSYADLNNKPALPSTFVSQISAGSGVTVSGGGTGAVTISASGGAATMPLTQVNTSASIAANGVYAITGNNVTLTLPGTPSAGNIVQILCVPGITGAVISTGTIPINNVAGSMNIDVPSACFSLIFVNSTYGWIIA